MRRLALVVLLVVAAATAGCRADAPADDSVVVGTTTGPVEGVDADGVSSWRGIPYAAPPVGGLRWRPPQPVEPWQDVVEADEYGPACLQGPPTALTETLLKVESTDEDCLTLNVHGPSDLDGPLPVMVWIHGGGFAYGAASQPVYNSPELVKRGIILVTVNYRLGRLGFFAHPALQESGSRLANYGLLDQIAALEWVQDNIAAFGGDPDNVTVFGESAGGVSVNALMASPEADGLFDRAIAQSGLGREPSQSWDDAVRAAEAHVSELAGGALDAEGLRGLDARDVMSAPIDILKGDAPVLDDVLTLPVDDAFAAGAETDVPYLAGTTDLEMPDAFLTRLGTDADQLRDELLGERKADALAAYGDESELDLHLLSDGIFTEPARYLARAHADDAPTYLYRFAIAPDSVLAEFGGALHTTELPFVFDDTGRQGTPVDDADALADGIADLWVDFATDGVPDGWPTAETGEIMSFTLAGPLAGPDPWAARLDVVAACQDRACARSDQD